METVSIRALQENLKQVLQNVRNGEAISILEDHIPIASIVPYSETADTLPSTRPIRSLRSIVLPTLTIAGVDSLQVLLEERQA